MISVHAPAAASPNRRVDDSADPSIFRHPDVLRARDAATPAPPILLRPRRRTAMIRSLLSVFVLSIAVPAAAQDAAEFERALDARMQAVGALSVEETLLGAAELVGTAPEESAGTLAATLDQAIERSAKISENAQLFAIAARIEAGDYDRALVAGRLAELLGSKSDDVGRAAAALLADRGFRELKEQDGDPLVARVRQAALDDARSPEYRIEASIALHMLGRGPEQRDARKTMIDYLGSSEARLRALGALALARVGDIETGRAELERLSALPSQEGRLADAYLKQEDIRRLYDRKQKNLVEWYQKQLEEADPKAKTDLRIIDKVIRMIETTSLEGDLVKREELIDSAVDGMLRSLDEHSSFMTAKVYKSFDQELLQAEYGGIGAYVGEDPDDHLFTITRPIYSGPAYRAGLHSDDKIVRIEDWPTFGPTGSQPTDEIIKRLKGKPGTSVKLYIWRRGMDPALIDRPTEDMAVTVTREQIQIPPVSAQMLPGKIGYVELTTFSRVASQALAATLEELKKDGMRGVILDLRNDSGGLLTEARDVANLFLPKKKLVVSTESRIDKTDKQYTQEDPLIPDDMPVAVLVNRFSASASEIVAGALQDYQRATLVGQRSFGKGSVQQLLPIPGERDDEFEDENQNGRHDSWEKLTRDWNENGEFDYAPRVRMTIARYLLPSGRSIHRELDAEGKIVSEGGVEPDRPVAARRFETWKAEEMIRLSRKDRTIRAYVEKNYPANQDLFRDLAEGDGDDTSAYPGFDDLYNALATPLSPQDVRFLVRNEVRRRVQDDRGAAFPEGDYQEDPQLQEAIRVVLGSHGESTDQFESYAKTFEPADPKANQPGRVLAAGMSDSARSGLRHALSLIDDARNQDGKLSPERLAEIERALQSVLDK